MSSLKGILDGKLGHPLFSGALLALYERFMKNAGNERALLTGGVLAGSVLVID
jgi:hypothetical protein